MMGVQRSWCNNLVETGEQALYCVLLRRCVTFSSTSGRKGSYKDPMRTISPLTARIVPKDVLTLGWGPHYAMAGGCHIRGW